MRIEVVFMVTGSPLHVTGRPLHEYAERPTGIDTSLGDAVCVTYLKSNPVLNSMIHTLIFMVTGIPLYEHAEQRYVRPNRLWRLWFLHQREGKRLW